MYSIYSMLLYRIYFSSRFASVYNLIIIFFLNTCKMFSIHFNHIMNANTTCKSLLKSFYTVYVYLTLLKTQYFS